MCVCVVDDDKHYSMRPSRSKSSVSVCVSVCLSLSLCVSLSLSLSPPLLPASPSRRSGSRGHAPRCRSQRALRPSFYKSRSMWPSVSAASPYRVVPSKGRRGATYETPRTRIEPGTARWMGKVEGGGKERQGGYTVVCVRRGEAYTIEYLYTGSLACVRPSGSMLKRTEEDVS